MKRVNAWCDCGWHGSYKSEPMAEHARRQHSCDSWREKRARARRHAERMRAVDRTPKPCLHEGAPHEHGTRNAYVLDYCRCLPCKEAAMAYETERKRKHAYGRAAEEWTDGDVVREHLATLQAAGLGWKRIAGLAGVSTGAVSKILFGASLGDGRRRPPCVRVRRETADKILTVRPSLHALAPAAPVAGVGTARRVQALAALGWSTPQIAARSGVDRQAIDRALRGQDVSAATARAIGDVYDRLWDQAPPEGDRWERAAAVRARHRAAASGWVPPAAWDDDVIDDPAAQPARAEGSSGADDRLTEWLHLVRSGEDHGRAADRVGVTLDTVERTAYRLGREDVLQILTAAATARRQERTHVIPTETRPRKRRVAA
ncbi:hypothetical protein GCM10027059_26140 [Myceligenerans halotolerans]